MAGDLCLIPDSEPFTLGEKIGTGSFATVYKAVDKVRSLPFWNDCIKFVLF